MEFINFTTIVKNEIEKRAGKNYHVRLKRCKEKQRYNIKRINSNAGGQQYFANNLSQRLF